MPIFAVDLIVSSMFRLISFASALLCTVYVGNMGSPLIFQAVYGRDESIKIKNVHNAFLRQLFSLIIIMKFFFSFNK